LDLIPPGTETFVVVATGLRHGGGKTVIEAFLKELTAASGNAKNIVLFLDSRLTTSVRLPNPFQIFRSQNTPLNQFRIDLNLKKTLGSSDRVLYLGSRSPFFKLSASVTSFIQNRLLVEDFNLSGYPLRTRLRLWLEKYLLRQFAKNTNVFWVQTKTMQRLASLAVKSENVFIKNIVDTPTTNIHSQKIRDFIYVASGEPHKNHENLFGALQLLGRENIFPKIALTLEQKRFDDLCRKFPEVRVDNLAGLSREQVLLEYSKSKALVFPSLLESLGLPLLEARALGLKILSSDLDFTHDSVSADMTFNPREPADIAEKMKAFILNS
jgi:glycosyltransferase involved in cell wall biosynthesis